MSPTSLFRVGGIRMISQELKQRLSVDGAVLEYEVVGAGQPVVLIHSAFIAEAYAALCAEPALTAHYRLVRYHRRGYAGSSRVAAPFSIAHQAADCRALLRHVGIERAHVVGHSSGGVMALRLALDAPEAVHSLILLEPALLDVPSGSMLGEVLGPVLQRYGAGDKEGAADSFLRWAIGPDYRTWLDRMIPGAYEQVLADVDTVFGVELRRCKSGSSPARTPGGSPSPCSASSARRVPRSGPAGTRWWSGCASGCRRPSHSCSRARTTRSRRRIRAASPRRCCRS